MKMLHLEENNLTSRTQIYKEVYKSYAYNLGFSLLAAYALDKALNWLESCISFHIC